MEKNMSNQAIVNELRSLRKDVTEIKRVMVTKSDQKRFATKDDLKSFATKDDLKSFATKDDLKSFATKDDLKRFATKDDLKNFATKDDFSKLSLAVLNLGNEIEITRKMAKADFQRVIDHIDGFAKKNLVHDRKAYVHDHRLSQLEPTVEDHEVRLTRLESKVHPQ